MSERSDRPNRLPSHAGDGQPGGLAAFCATADVSLLTDLLQRLNRVPVTLQAGGPAEAAAWCATNPLPSLLLVDISGTPHPLHALAELGSLCGPANQIVVIGDRQDVDLYRTLLQGGAFDYLLKPLTLGLLASTLARAAEGTPLGLGGNARAGRTVAITGAAGGVGTSTVAAGLALLLANQRQTPTVLVDFDRSKGDLPLLLGLEADVGLSSVLAAPEVDPRLLQRTLHVHPGDAGASPRLHLLAQRPGRVPPVDPERVLELGGALSQLFSLSLWDLPAHLPDGAGEVLEHADIRIVLTQMNVQHARHVLRLLGEMGDESAGQRLLLVSNGVHSSDGGAIGRAQFEEFVGRPIDAELPHAGNALVDSLLNGPLRTAAHPAFDNALHQLADKVLGRQSRHTGAAQAESWLRKLLGARAPDSARAA